MGSNENKRRLAELEAEVSRLRKQLAQQKKAPAKKGDR